MPSRFLARRPAASADSQEPSARNAQEAAVARVAETLGDQFAWFLSPVRLQARAEDLRLIERVGKIDVGIVTVAMVLASLMRSSDAEGRILDAFAIYRQIGGAPATKEGFRRAVHRIADLLLDLVKARIADASRSAAPLRGRLASFTDLLIPDGSVFKLAAALAEGLPGTGSAAALKLHAVYSVRAAGPAAVDFTDGREHDTTHFTPAWVRGALYLWDLGYNDYARVLDAQAAGSHVLQRLKDGADPKVLAWYSPDGARHALALPPNRRVVRLGEACEFYDELRSQETLDLDVELRDASGRTGVMRVVCVPFEGRDRYYLTTLPRTHFTPHDVAELYGVRWEVELYLKDLQGGARADEVTRLRNLDSLRAVVYASLLAQMLSGEVTRAANEAGEEDTAPTRMAGDPPSQSASLPPLGKTEAAFSP